MTRISSLGNSFVGGLTNRSKRNKAMITRHVKKGFYAIKKCFALEPKLWRAKWAKWLLVAQLSSIFDGHKLDEIDKGMLGKSRN